jgi:hypothetical protein
VIRAERFGPFAAATSLAISFLVFGLAGVYTVRQQNEVNGKLCQSTVANRSELRRSWLAAERFIIQGQPTEEARERTRLFFREVLNEIPPIECVDRKPVEVQSG